MTGIFTLTSKVIDKIFPDKTEAEKAKLRLVELEQSGELARMTELREWDKAQTVVNAVEAAHRSVFVAGWRPFIGWVCGSALAMSMVILPLAEFILANIFNVNVVMPEIAWSELSVIAGGMLGIGGLRTYEKCKGVSR